MFDPRVNGYALSKVRTPAPTKGVTVAVNTEEDCTKNVTIAPKTIIKYLKQNYFD